MGSLENSNSFIGAFGIPFGFGVKDGKVFYGPVEDSYKEFLITFNRWYTNGLIDPDFFLLSKSGLNKKVNSGNVGSFIGSVDNFKVSTDALLSIDSSSELIPAPYPVLQNTDALNVLSSAPVVSEYGITICSPNKYPTETMKLIDYTFSNEGHKLLNYGIEGHTYTINDGQIQYTDLIINNPDDLSVEQAMLKYLFPLSALNGYNTDESFAKFYIYPQQKNALSLWTVNPGDTNPSCLPTVSLTREEDRELSTIMKSISIYRDEMFAIYTLGVESLESFDKYVGNVNEMGINRAIDILQTALNRYNHRIPVLEVNDKPIETDTEPVLFINGETLLPIRFVIESLGGSVAWDGKNKIVTGIWNDTVIILKLNSTDVLVNYEHRTLNHEITVMNKRTYISTDFLEDVLGITIDWDENIRTVIVSSN